jgi:hypothetical protein
MAQLPPDGTWLMQQHGGIVIISHRYTEQEILRFDPQDANAVAKVQKTIYELTQLTDEQKCFAHFWSGYFYAHATGRVAGLYGKYNAERTDGEEAELSAARRDIS